MGIFTISDQGYKKTLTLQSPADLRVVGNYDCASHEEIKSAMSKSRIAQTKWAEVPLIYRAELMHRVIDVIIENQDHIMNVVMEETGKPIQEAMSMEIFSAIDSLAFYAKRAPKWLRDEKRSMHGPMSFLKKTRVTYKPRGVVAVITPWNGPFILSINPTIQALLAGNSVIIKPSEVTPRSGKLVEDIFLMADAPQDLVQVIIGDGLAGAQLIDEVPDKVSFTGSIATGKKIAKQCSENLIPFSLELGGKDAMIVCSDADIDDAAKGAVIGSCMNAGQYCCGTERIYVVEDVYDEFVEKVVHETKQLNQSSEGFSDIGATFWDKQLDIIEDHVEDAVQKGAHILVGGKRNPSLKGLYFEPTVIINVNHQMKVMTDETFGPVISIMRVKSENDALRLANDSYYGLNGNVWTQNMNKGMNLAKAMETGACSINDMAMSYGVNEAPFGGIKQSGLGSVNGKEGLRSYAHAMPIIIGKKSASSYPYTEKSFKDMKGALKFFWGNKFLRRIWG